MVEHWRENLYFLGFLSSLAFGGRFILQWLASEAKGKSVIPPLFWRLSLAGNVLLLLHAFLQIQFHVVFVQACNGVISWRNLNLLKPQQEQLSWKTTGVILAVTITVVSLLFALQAYYLPEGSDLFFRIPTTPWNKKGAGLGEISPAWHALGFGGLLLFNSRFWVQWWSSEQRHASYVGPSFWWISLVGDILCMAYFVRLGDIVNLIGPCFGIIPYIRNLMLIYKSQKSSLPERAP